MGASLDTLETIVRRALDSSKIFNNVRSAELRDYVQARSVSVVPHLEAIPNAFGEYTDHGVTHSCRVLELADGLVSTDLSDWEALVFVLAVFHHDVGMSCSSSEIERLEKEAGFQRDRPLLEEFVVPGLELIGADPTLRDQQVKTEYLRRHHGPRCVDWIREHFSRESADAFVQTIYPWDAVAAVSLGHTLTVQKLQTSDYVRSYVIAPQLTVDALFLTCLLRLADICHMSRDRALPYIRKTKVFSSGYSEKIWKKEGEIAGVASNPETQTIIVRATPSNFERHRLIDESVQGISKELSQLHQLLSRQPGPHSLPWKYVDDTRVRSDDDAGYLFEPEGRFRLIEEQIVELLMGSRLYAQPLYAVRECLQNAADAIRVHQLKSPHARHRVVIQFRRAEGSPGYLEIFDSGTGMDRHICA